MIYAILGMALLSLIAALCFAAKRWGAAAKESEFEQGKNKAVKAALEEYDNVLNLPDGAAADELRNKWR